MALDLRLTQALAFRLHRQCLASPAPDVVTAATRLLGAQAQVHSAAVLQLRARCRTVSAAAIAAALQDRRDLVKIWAQRSTLHLVATADLPMVLALVRRFVHRYHRHFANHGLSHDQITQLAAAIGEAVAERPMSRADLADRLTPRLGQWARPWLESSWGGAVKLAALMGLLCHGPDRSRETTFVGLDGWVAPPPATVDRDHLGLLARRYLGAYGPATPRDLAKFTGLDAAAARGAFERIVTDLMPVSVAGARAWALAADERDLRGAEMPAGAINVLPHFDPYLLAHADTGQVVPPRHRKRIYRIAGWISPVVLREGRVVAVWSQRRAGTRWTVTVEPLARLGKRPLRRAERGLRALAGAVGVTDIEFVES
ncbi:MAG: winged helix DNA-binding domain-containing protein [Alphaproteobacteria bacterium]